MGLEVCIRDETLLPPHANGTTDPDFAYDWERPNLLAEPPDLTEKFARNVEVRYAAGVANGDASWSSGRVGGRRRAPRGVCRLALVSSRPPSNRA
jgi:hypothetical protein